MNWGASKGKKRAGADSSDISQNLPRRLADLSQIRDTPALIAYLANDRARLLLCKALVSPVSESDRKLVERAHRILRSQRIDPEGLKARLEPAALALGLGGACDAQIDYYQVLGVKPSATASELRAAYRKKAFTLHPDTARRGTEDGADFLTVKTAYDTLTNPDSRVAFDRCRIALDAWHEENTGEWSEEAGRKQPRGKVRKAFFRVAAVVAVMIGVAWVISIVYEHETMVELVEVKPATGPAREAAKTADKAGVVEKKAPVVPERVDARVTSKPAPKDVVIEKKVPDKPTPVPLQTAALPTEPRKVDGESTVPAPPAGNTAVLTPPESVDAPGRVNPRNALREEATAPLKVPDVEEKKPDGEPVIEASAPKAVQEKGPREAPAAKQTEEQTLPPPPAPEPAQIASSITPEAREKQPEDGPKTKKLAKVKKEKPIDGIEIARKDPPKPVLLQHSKLTKSKEAEDRQVKAPAALKLPAVDEKKPNPELAQVFTVKVAPAAEQVEEQKLPVPEVSQAPDPSQSLPAAVSVRVEENPPTRVFPKIPVPKTYKTPFVKRSQVVEFLRDYTAAYEKGNAEVFFSFFTDNALENGKPLKSIKPDYLEIWEKVQRLNYRISVDETEQVVDSQWVSMKGRFDLAWQFLDGGNGRSHGDISMDLKVNKDALRILRLDYRFDE